MGQRIGPPPVKSVSQVSHFQPKENESSKLFFNPSFSYTCHVPPSGVAVPYVLLGSGASSYCDAVDSGVATSVS